MLTKTKIALAALLVAGTASLAVAQEADPNLLNRYPAYNGANGAGDSPVVTAPRSFRSAPVGLSQDHWVGQAPIATQGRPEVLQFHYDSAPLQGGAGG